MEEEPRFLSVCQLDSSNVTSAREALWRLHLMLHFSCLLEVDTDRHTVDTDRQIVIMQEEPLEEIPILQYGLDCLQYTFFLPL
jgi:hypothetical protein